MHLYSYFRSSSSYRCRIALNLKGIEVEYVPVHLLKDGGHQKLDRYTTLNPQGLVPALVTDDGTALAQSLAIIEWLDEAHPEPPLLPDSPLQRAKVRAFSHHIACEIQPLQNTRILQHLSGVLGQDPQQIKQWCQKWIGQGLAACDRILESQDKKSEFCFGDQPGLADICLVPQVFSARRFEVDLDRYENIRRIAANCERLEAFERAHPANQPDAE